MLLYQSTPSGVKALSKLALTQYKRLSNNGHWPPSPTVPRKQADTHPSAFHAVAFPAAFQALSDEIQLICKDILVEHTMVLVTTLKPSVTSAAKLVTSVPTVQTSPRVPKLTHGKKPNLPLVALKPSLGMAENGFGAQNVVGVKVAGPPCTLPARTKVLQPPLQMHLPLSPSQQLLLAFLVGTKLYCFGGPG